MHYNLISAKVLNKKIDAVNDLNDIYNNVKIECKGSENFNRKSNPDYTAKDNLVYTVTCSLPKYNYSITSGFTADRQYDMKGDIDNNIYFHAMTDNGQEKRMKIPENKIKELEKKVEKILYDKTTNFSAGLDDNARAGTFDKNSSTRYHYPNENNSATVNPTNANKNVVRGIESDF